MNRFAELLDRLAYEPGRNNKLRLIADYFPTTPDPERGFALAALTGALSFQHAKAGVIRALIAERTDPVLFELSYDYVGDLSETVALMWPADPAKRPNAVPSLFEVIANRRPASARARTAAREPGTGWHQTGVRSTSTRASWATATSASTTPTAARNPAM